jgi:hypothetical protein
MTLETQRGPLEAPPSRALIQESIYDKFIERCMLV